MADDPYASAAITPSNQVTSDPYASAAVTPPPAASASDPYASAAASPPPQSNQVTGGGAAIPKPTSAAEAAIQKYVKDPHQAALQRMVVGLESGGGHPEQPNKYGAYGPYQITPDTAKTYGLDYSRLNDLQYATSAANIILSDLMKKSHGDMAQAAIGYNAGPGYMGKPFGAVPSEAQVYAQRVVKGLAELNTQQPGGPTPQQKAAVLRQHLPPPSAPEHDVLPPGMKAAQAGLPLDPRGLLHGIQRVFAKGEEEADYAHRHPGEAFMAMEGVLERPAGTLLAGALDFKNGLWKDPARVIRQAGMSVIHPQDHDKIIGMIEDGIVHDLGFGNINPSQMHGLGKAVMDFAVDLGIDPFSYVGVGEVLKLTGLAAKFSARTAYSVPIVKATLEAAGKTPGGQALVKEMTKHMTETQNFFNAVKKIQYDLFGKRKDLDVRFTGGKMVDGVRVGGKPTQLFDSLHAKMARMGIEQGATESVEKAGQRAESALFKDKGIKTALEATTHGDALKGMAAGTTFWKHLPSEVSRYALTTFAHYGDAATREWSVRELDKMGMTIPKEELDKFPGGFIKVPETGITDVTGLHEFLMLSNKEVAEHVKGLPEGVLAAHDFFKAGGKTVTEATSSEYMKNFFTMMRYQTRRRVIARQSAQLALMPVGTKGKFLASMPKGMKTEDQLTGFFLREVRDHADPFRLPGKVSLPWAGKMHTKTTDQWLNTMANGFKASILGNPFPHGIVNLGMVVLAHANPLVAGRALKYMVPKVLGGKGVPTWLTERLAQGAKTSYWRENIPSFATLSNIPGLKKIGLPQGLQKWYGASTQALDHMEHAWRASYLQHLDKTMGTLSKDDPSWLMHELAKLQTVNEHLGDYSNPSKAAAILRALGGLYTVFRFDVVPKATRAALEGKVGQSLGAGVKFGHDIGKEFGGGDLHINIVDDMTKILLAAPTAFNPGIGGIGGTGIDYATSIASLGPIFGSMTTGIRNHFSNLPIQTLPEAIMGMAEYLVIGGASMQSLMDPSKAEKRITSPWFRFAMHLLGGWYSHTNPKTEAGRRKQFNKAANKPLPLGMDNWKL